MDIRQEFLDFFASKGHDVVSSMPLVPDDPTLMFTNAGMVQFKDIFTGSVPIPQNPRATSCQLCVRAGGKHNDLENVGYTARHHTLFEMLGNFSFGDYFKVEAIAYAWEFVTKNLALPIDKLWVTVHENDDEAFEIWSQHIDPSRIMRFGDKDNFWSMGDTGACGPCSEIFYDQGAEHFNSAEDKMGGDGDRFLEIWNLVFMQYERTAAGELKPLPKPSIDTGMGLERVIAIKEGVLNNFDSSNFMPIIEKLESLAPHKKTKQNIGSYRVIADHLRACSFMLSQGILFGNEGRPYVNRRIVRRAVRHGYLLGFREPFMAKLYDSLCDIMGQHYADLVEKKEYVKEQFTLEEERFFKTIDSGMELFEAELENTQNLFSGDVAFKLYDEKGFPLDLTEDMLKDKGMSVDIERFEVLMNEQKAKAKASWKGSGDSAKDGDFKAILETIGKNEFIGYETIQCDATIVALLNENFKQIEVLEANQSGWVMLDKTPFYATSGGQEGDVGTINGAEVVGTQKFFDINLSHVVAGTATIKVGDSVQAIVQLREEVAKHHSATHLLQSALRGVLGETVSQAGSLNDDKRLRFDFTYPKAMSKGQKDEAERLVNQWITLGKTGNVEELPIDEAKQKGAIAMFGEKYGDVVRVVSFGDVSVEFCGGTHVQDTRTINTFLITKESGVSAGVRRIEAICGDAAQRMIEENNEVLSNAQALLNTKDIITGIENLKKEIKALKSGKQPQLDIPNEGLINLDIFHTRDILDEAKSLLKSQEIIETIEKLLAQRSEAEVTQITKQEVDINTFAAHYINGVTVIIEIIEDGELKELVDEIKNKYDSISVMLLMKKEDKVLLAAGSKNSPIKAGDWIKTIAPIVGGGGGGRPDFAQAGGKDASRITTALEEAKVYVSEILEGGN